MSFLLQKCSVTVLSLSEPQVLSFAPFSKGLSTLNFVLGLPLGFFWDAQGCVDRVLSRTA